MPDEATAQTPELTQVKGLNVAFFGVLILPLFPFWGDAVSGSTLPQNQWEIAEALAKIHIDR